MNWPVAAGEARQPVPSDERQGDYRPGAGTSAAASSGLAPRRHSCAGRRRETPALSASPARAGPPPSGTADVRITRAASRAGILAAQLQQPGPSGHPEGAAARPHAQARTSVRSDARTRRGIGRPSSGPRPPPWTPSGRRWHGGLSMFPLVPRGDENGDRLRSRGRRGALRRAGGSISPTAVTSRAVQTIGEASGSRSFRRTCAGRRRHRRDGPGPADRQPGANRAHGVDTRLGGGRALQAGTA